MDLWARQPNKAEFVNESHVHCASKREKQVKIRQNKKDKEDFLEKSAGLDKSMEAHL